MSQSQLYKLYSQSLIEIQNTLNMFKGVTSKLIILIVMLQSCSSFVYGQKDQRAVNILQKSGKILKGKNLFKYKASYKIKYFDYSDTSHLGSYDCIVFKKPADSILGYYAKLTGLQHDERIYDGQNFYLIFHNEKKVIGDNPKSTGKSFTKNNIKRQFIPSFLISINPFEEWINDSKEIKLIGEAILNERKSWEIEITLAADAEVTSSKIYIFIDKENYLPLKQVYKAKYLDIQEQYSELYISDLKIINDRTTDFSNLYKFPIGYQEEVYKAPNINYDLLPIESELINFSLKDLNGKVYNSEKLVQEHQLILVDFWYLACPPCISAIPELIKLTENYKEKGLLTIGLNSIDKSNVRILEIKKIAEKMGINYPLLSSTSIVDNAYLVKAYPTLYLIKYGKIIYSHFGYSKESFDKLELMIRNNLTN